MEWSSIYKNRFQSMKEILFSGHFHWENGCIVPDAVFFSSLKKNEIVSPISYNTDQLKKTKERIKPYKNNKHLKSLHDSWIVEAKFDLQKAKFLEKNIDVFASEFIGIESKEIAFWLLMLDRDWFYEPHACICKIPVEINSDWQEAIRGFLLEVMPHVNEQFTVLNNPFPEHKKIYDFFNKLFKRFEK